MVSSPSHVPSRLEICQVDSSVRVAVCRISSGPKTTGDGNESYSYSRHYQPRQTPPVMVTGNCLEAKVPVEKT